MVYFVPAPKNPRARSASATIGAGLTATHALEVYGEKMHNMFFNDQSMPAENSDPETGLPLEVQKSRQTGLFGKTQFYKQVVAPQKGYLNPTELVAIMGPSGAGKTSLLNVLSQRHSTAGGAHAGGSVLVNGRPLNFGDFGKVAAFV